MTEGGNGHDTGGQQVSAARRPPDADPRPGRSPYEAPQVQQLIGRAIEILESARPLPLSTSVKLDHPEEVLELLDEALERMPEELRAAKWLLKQREEFLARTRSEADDILERARSRAEQMVQRTEVVKSAEGLARRRVEEADAEARRLTLEAEDFCDQRLASFEIVLERTMKVVAAGRAKLQAAPSAPRADEGPERAPFFDQDTE